MSDGQQQRKRPNAKLSVMMDPHTKIPRAVAQQPNGREGIIAALSEKQTTSTVGGSSTSAIKTQPSHSAGPVVQFGSFAGKADGGSPDPATLGCQSVLFHGGMSPEGISLIHRLSPKWRLFMSFAPSMGYSVLEKRQLILLEDVEKIYLPKKPIWEVIADHEANYRALRPNYVPPTVFPFAMSDQTRQMIAQLYPDFCGFCFLADYLGYSVIEKRRHILLEDIYFAYTNSLPEHTIQEGVVTWEENYNSVRCKFGLHSLPPAESHPAVVVPADPQPKNSEFATSSKDAELGGLPVNHQRPPVENASHAVGINFSKRNSVKSLGDERRSRKQKSPPRNRNGLDSRDINQGPQHVLVGQQDVLKHPDGRNAAAAVTDDSQIVTYYCIEFSDGLISRDTSPEDICNYNCREDGPPPLGAAVEVLWNDDGRVMGNYRGQVQHRIHKLSEPASVSPAPRNPPTMPVKGHQAGLQQTKRLQTDYFTDRPLNCETLIEDSRGENLNPNVDPKSRFVSPPKAAYQKVDSNPQHKVGTTPIPQNGDAINITAGTANKNTSITPSSSSAANALFSRKNDPKLVIKQKNRLESLPEATREIVNFNRHQCSKKCVADYPYRTGRSKNKNPTTIPTLWGFHRELIKKRNVKTLRNKIVVYSAPCGRRLRNMDEVHRYLRLTRSRLGVDLFCFDSNVDCFNRTERKPGTRLIKKDISSGKENVPLSCINSVDRSSRPSLVDYCTERIPRPGVDLNLDPDFLACCDCTDDCQDKEKCQCWQLTIQATAAGPGGTINPDVGYKYRRLTENVVTGIYECNKRCKCRGTCLNRVAQRPLQMRLQLFKTRKCGWGIRCLYDIPKGQFICVYVGELLTGQEANEELGDDYYADLDFIKTIEKVKEGYESEVADDFEDSSSGDTLMKPHHLLTTTMPSRKNEKSSSRAKMSALSFYPVAIGNINGEKLDFYNNDNNCFVMDAKNTGNIGRYFNHSCEPNIFVQNVFVDTHDLRFPWIAFFALKHIRAGTELTWDYGYVVDSVPGKKLVCHCGAKTCRGRLL